MHDISHDENDVFDIGHMSQSVLSRDMNPLKVATRENMFLFLNYYVAVIFTRSMKSHLIVHIDYTHCQDQYKISL